MRERYLAERFNVELERINTLNIVSKDEPDLSTRLEEKETFEELVPIIELAETMINVDFSGESGIKNSLLERLLRKFPEQIPDSTNKPRVNMELSDDDLDRVAGGLTNQHPNGTTCSLCGFRSRSSTLESENCSSCGHPRSGHK